MNPIKKGLTVLRAAVLLLTAACAGAGGNDEAFYVAGTRYNTAISQLESWLE